MRKRFIFFFLILTILGALLTPVLGQPKVEAISLYRMDIQIEGNDVHVVTVITLKNLIDKPLVPGIGEVRLQKISPRKILIFPIPGTEKREAVNVENVKAQTLDGRTIQTRVMNNKTYTVIQYEIWYPIEPKKNLTFVLEYTMKDLIEGGILFREVDIPIGADLDISSIRINVTADAHVTYSKTPEKGIPAGYISFAEYEISSLPFPEVGYKWSNILWGTVLLIIMLTVAISLVRGKS